MAAPRMPLPDGHDVGQENATLAAFGVDGRGGDQRSTRGPDPFSPHLSPAL